MKNTTAVLLMALGLALPATTFGQSTDSAPRATTKRSAQRKMTVSNEAPPAATSAKPAAATLANAPSTPAEPSATPVKQRRRPMPALIAAVDVNHDGVLDAAEIAKASESLRKLDKNDDGTLAAEEVHPRRASRPGSTSSGGAETGAAAQRAPSPARLGVVDANKDGMIDAAEISSASQVLAKFDKDGDGKVTLDELRTSPSRAARGSAPASKE